MTKGIEQDLFAKVMRMPSEQRKDVLEFLGQSVAIPVAEPLKPDACAAPATEAGSGHGKGDDLCGEAVGPEPAGVTTSP
jgi:hypothetical protein